MAVMGVSVGCAFAGIRRKESAPMSSAVSLYFPTTLVCVTDDELSRLSITLMVEVFGDLPGSINPLLARSSTALCSFIRLLHRFPITLDPVRPACVAQAS